MHLHKCNCNKTFFVYIIAFVLFICFIIKLEAIRPSANRGFHKVGPEPNELPIPSLDAAKNAGVCLSLYNMILLWSINQLGVASAIHHEREVH